MATECGYHLYQSPNLNQFIEDHSSVFFPSNILEERPLIIVQNQNTSEWLKRALCRKTGCCADLDIVYPEKALRLLLEQGLDKNDRPDSILFLDSLKMVLFERMDRIADSDEPVFSSLRQYFTRDGAGRERLLYGFTDILSGLFNRYSMNSPELTGNWGEGRSFLHGSWTDEESWQSAVWQEAFPTGGQRPLLGSLIGEVLQGRRPFRSTGRRIVLYGSSFFGVSGLEFLRFLSRSRRVDHFLFSPSAAYCRPLAAEEKHPLLRSWGGISRGIRRFTEDSVTGSWSAPVSPASDSILRKLQLSLHNDSPDPGFSGDPADSSLMFYNCPGAVRQVESLKDDILGCLNRDPQLTLNDICVMAPDINVFSSLISQIFPDRDDEGHPCAGHLPFNIVDAKIEEDTDFLRAVRSLADLVGSRWERTPVLDFLSNPCVLKALDIPEDEAGLWSELTEKASIRWGYDGKQRKESGAETGEPDWNSWASGLERLLDHLCTGNQGPDAFFNLESNQRSASASQLVFVVRNLHEDLSVLNRRRLPIIEWVYLFEAVCEQYLAVRGDHPEDEKDRRLLKGVFRDLINAAEEAGSGRLFGFGVFQLFLKELIRRSEGGFGRFLTQGITCSSLRPLRAIPFKAVFLLGMDEGVFPGQEHIPGYDLTEALDLPLDLSRRGSESFSFLETICSVGDILHIYYNGKQAFDGLDLNPSPFVRELQDWLIDQFGNKDSLEHLIREVPLQRCDPVLYRSSAPVRSLSRKGYAEAAALSAPPPAQEGIKAWGRFDCADEWSIGQLFSFLKSPPAFFAEQRLRYRSSFVQRVPEDREIYNPEPDFQRLCSRSAVNHLDFLSRDDLPELLGEYGVKLQKIYPDFFREIWQNSFAEWQAGVGEHARETGWSADSRGLSVLFQDTARSQSGTALETFPALRFGNGGAVSGRLDGLWKLAENRGWLYPQYYNSSGKPASDYRARAVLTASLLLAADLMPKTSVLHFPVFTKKTVFAFKLRCSDAEGVAEQLLPVLKRGLQRPLPVYPVMFSSFEREEDIHPDTLIAAWNSQLQKTQGYNPLKDCPYREFLFPGALDTEEACSDIRTLFRILYGKEGQ